MVNFDFDFNIYPDSPLSWALYLLFLVLGIQLFYYFFFYLRLSVWKEPVKGTDAKEPVTIIICARNEAENLKNNLPRVLEQDYPHFEVVVVNDSSVDETDEVLYSLSTKYPNLRFTSLPEEKKFTHGKKLAVALGIKAAKNEWLVFTDADCVPASSNWLKEISKGFGPDKSIVLGYGKYNMEKSLINNFIRYETAFIGMQYLSFALAKFPYMGVGRNMAYRKSLFFSSRGFSGHYHIQSGDDDLFINQVSTSQNVSVIVSHESFTISEPKKTFRQWIKQKRRHITTGKYYKFRHRVMLSLEPISRMFFYGLLIFLFSTGNYIVYAFAALLTRLILQLIAMKINYNRLNEKYLLLPSLIYDIVTPVLWMVPVTINRISGKRSSWK